MVETAMNQTKMTFVKSRWNRSRGFVKLIANREPTSIGLKVLRVNFTADNAYFDLPKVRIVEIRLYRIMQEHHTTERRQCTTTIAATDRQLFFTALRLSLAQRRRMSVCRVRLCMYVRTVTAR